jgi:hypothetical protein
VCCPWQVSRDLQHADRRAFIFLASVHAVTRHMLVNAARRTLRERSDRSI